MIDIKNQLEQLLKKETSVVFENVPLTGELTHFLYSESNITKIYLIKYENSVFDQVKQTISNKEVYSIESLTISHLNQQGIIYCLNNSNYFNPNYSLIAIQKNIRGICFLGFPENNFATSPKSKDCIVTNKSISDLITSNKVISALQHQTDTNRTRICHNRNIEKDSLVNFLANANERLLLIHGFPGFGKSNLLDELKRKAPNREYLQFNFESKSDTYKDIIGELSPYFSLSVSIDDLRQTEINDRNQRTLVKSFFDSFNIRDNSTLIFESVHKVVYHDTNNTGLFISPDMTLFFKQLVTHNEFKGSNKIIFVSRSPLHLNDEIRRFSNEIKVKELEPFYIKRIMSDEFNRLNRPELSVKIGSFPDDEKIETAICGHPGLALRFVDASLNHGLEELLGNQDFRSKIGYELKVKWLLDNYPLEENEKIVLETLSLFTSELPDHFISINFNNAHNVLKTLVNRYLVDVHFYKDGTAKYFVPTLIKDYIKGISKPEVLKNNHLKIADYFWNKAEDITVSSQEKVLAYRKAFYHFRESGNHERLKLLVMRFKEKFIIEAMESARDKMWKDAYFYFNELHSHNQIGIEHPKEYNQFIKVLSRINPKPKNTATLIEEIHNMFPNDSFIAVTYADYLFDKKNYQQSKGECQRIKSLIASNKSVRKDFLSEAIIDNTLAKCEYKLGNKIEATNLIEKWRKYFSRKGIHNLTISETYHYQAMLMTEYEGLNCYEEYLDKKNAIITQLLENDPERSTNRIPFLLLKNQFTYCLEGEWQQRVSKQFELTKSIKQDEKLIASENNFKRHIVTALALEKYSSGIKQKYFGNDIQLYVDQIDNLIQKGKSLLQEVQYFDKDSRHFQSNYSLCSLLQVEADFYLVSWIINNPTKEK